LARDLYEGEIEIRFPVVGIESDGLLYFLNGSRIIPLANLKVREGHVDLLIVGLLLQKLVDLLLSLLEIASRNQEIRQVDAGGIIVGLKLEGAGKFLIGRIPLLQLEQSLRQPVMRVAVCGINLDGVLVLNGSFAILAFVVVALPALIVFLLAHVGIAGASDEDRRNQCKRQKQTKSGRRLHYKSPETGAVGARLFCCSHVCLLGYIEKPSHQSFAPLGLVGCPPYPRLAPWAAFLRRSAAKIAAFVRRNFNSHAPTKAPVFIDAGGTTEVVPSRSDL
jgi:hypothetical protein